MARSKLASTLTAAIAVSVLAACSSPAPAPAVDAAQPNHAPAPTGPRPTPETPLQAPAEQSATRTNTPSQRETGSTPTRSTDGSAGERAQTSAASHRAADAASVTCIQDQTSDTTSGGRPPEYTDIVEACVRGQRDAFRLDLTVAGSVPERMPDRDTTMNAGFELRLATGAEYYVFAEADSNGWTAYLTRGDGKRALSDALKIKGRTIQLTVKSSLVDDARQFAWKAETSWTRSELLRTSYAFDTAPDRGHASYPRGS